MSTSELACTHVCGRVRSQGCDCTASRASENRRAHSVFRSVLALVRFQPGRVVIKNITPLEGSRRCFRLVGGVLVERTVSEVLPAVKENQAGVS